MQIGYALDDEENKNNVWSEISELLTNCKYKQLKQFWWGGGALVSASDLIC